MTFFFHVFSAEQEHQDEYVQLLVDAGANPLLQDKNGRTACYYNRRHGYIISSECTGCSSDDDCDECCGGCSGNCCDNGKHGVAGECVNHG